MSHCTPSHPTPNPPYNECIQPSCSRVLAHRGISVVFSSSPMADVIGKSTLCIGYAMFQFNGTFVSKTLTLTACKLFCWYFLVLLLTVCIFQMGNGQNREEKGRGGGGEVSKSKPSISSKPQNIRCWRRQFKEDWNPSLPINYTCKHKM